MATGFAMQSGSHSQDQIVTVKLSDVRTTQEFASSDTFIAAALNKIESGVFQGGLSVSITEFNRDVDVSEDHQEVISTSWQQAAIRIMREFFTIGYAVVRPVSHAKYPGEWEPYVVPYSKYELQFVETSQQPRQYFVNYLDVAYPAASIAELSDRRRAAVDSDTATAAPPPKRSKTLPTAAIPVVPFDASIMQLQFNEVYFFSFIF